MKTFIVISSLALLLVGCSVDVETTDTVVVLANGATVSPHLSQCNISPVEEGGKTER
jgi:hypothetical protein